jgi:hypothetical protein
MSKPEAYVTSIVEYLTNTEVLILEGQRAIVKKLGLTQEKVEESEVHLMERGLAQTILLIQSGLRTKVKYFMSYLENHFNQKSQLISKKLRKS